MAHASFGRSNNWRTLVTDNDKEFDLGKELRELQKAKKQLSVLQNLLVSKGILTEDEIKEYIDSIDVIDHLSEEE